MSFKKRFAKCLDRLYAIGPCRFPSATLHIAEHALALTLLNETRPHRGDSAPIVEQRTAIKTAHHMDRLFQLEDFIYQFEKWLDQQSAPGAREFDVVKAPPEKRFTARKVGIVPENQGDVEVASVLAAAAQRVVFNPGREIKKGQVVCFKVNPKSKDCVITAVFKGGKLFKTETSEI